MACEIKIVQYKSFVTNLINTNPEKFTKYDNVVKFVFDGPLTDEQKKLAVFNVAHIFAALQSVLGDKIDLGKSVDIIRSANAIENTQEFISNVNNLYSFEQSTPSNENTILSDIKKVENFTILTDGNIDPILKSITDYFSTTGFNTEEDKIKIKDQFKQEFINAINNGLQSAAFKEHFINKINYTFDKLESKTPYISMASIEGLADLNTELITLTDGQIVEATKNSEGKYVVSIDNQRHVIEDEDIIESKSARLKDNRKTNDGKQILDNDIFSSGLVIRAVDSRDQERLMEALNGMSNPSSEIKIKAVRISNAGDQRINRIHDLSIKNPDEYGSLKNRNHETWENAEQEALLSKSPDAKILTISRPKASEQSWALVGELGDGTKFYIYSLENYVFVNANNSTEHVDFSNEEHRKLVKNLSVKSVNETNSKNSLVQLAGADLDNLQNAQELFKKFRESNDKAISDSFAADPTLNSVDITADFGKAFEISNVKGTDMLYPLSEVLDNQTLGMLSKNIRTYSVVTLDDNNKPVGDPELIQIPFIFTKVVSKTSSGKYVVTYKQNTVLGSNQRIRVGDKYYTEQEFVVDKNFLGIDRVLERNFKAEDEKLVKDLMNKVPSKDLVRTNNFVLYYSTAKKLWVYRVLRPKRALEDSENFVTFITRLTTALKSTDPKEAISFFNKNVQSFQLVTAGTKGTILRVNMELNNNGQLVLQVRSASDRYDTIITKENKHASFDFIIDKNKIIKTIDDLTKSDLVKKVIAEYPTLKNYKLDTEDGIQRFYSDVFSLSKQSVATENIKTLVEKVKESVNTLGKQLTTEVIDKLEEKTKDVPEFMKALKEDLTFNETFMPELLVVNKNEKGELVPKIEFVSKNKSDKQDRAKSLNGWSLVDADKKTTRIISKSNSEVSPQSIVNTAPTTVTPTATETPTNNTTQENEDIYEDNDPLSVVETVVNPATKEDIAFQRQWLAANLPQFGLDIDSLKDIVDLTKIDGHVLGMMKNKTVFLNSELTGKGTLYHESFHGVFRYLMDSTRRKELIDAVVGDKKHASMFTEDALKEFGRKRNLNYSTDVLARLQAEEILADGFQNYMLKGTKPKGLIAKFFEMLKKLLDFFIKNGNIIDQEYQNISSGYYKSSVIQSEIFKDQVAFELIPSLPIISRDNNNKVKSSTQYSLSPLEQKQLVNIVVYTMLEKKLNNSEKSSKTFDADFDSAVKKLLSETYNLEKLKKAYPDKAEQINKILGPLYSNYAFVLGGRLQKGVEIFDINKTDNPKFNNSKAEIKLKQLDDTQVDNTNGQHSLEILKKLVKSSYDNITSIQIGKSEAQLDQEEIEKLNEKSAKQKDDPDADLENEIETDSDSDASLGEFNRIDANVGQVRRFLSTIRRDYIHPELGILIPRVIDGEDMFSAIMKITSDIDSSDIMSNIQRRIDRMEEDGKEEFAKDLKAVYDKILVETQLDENGKPTLNNQMFNMLIDAFHGIELNYVMTTANLPKPITINSTEEETMNPKSISYTIKDTVAETDNRTKLNSLLAGMIETHGKTAMTKAYENSTEELIKLLPTIYNSTTDMFGTNTPNETLEKLTNDLYKHLQVIGLNVPKSLIRLSLLAINTVENESPLSESLSKKHTELYNDDLNFVKEKKYLEKDFFRSLDSILKTKIYTGYNEKTKTSIPNSNFKTILDESDNKNTAKDVNRFIVILKNASAYVVKYDPSVLPSVIRNAEGKMIYRYSKVNPLSLMAQEFRKRGLKGALELDPYFQNFLKSFMEDNHYFGDIMKDNITEKSKKMNVFLDNLQVVMFGGVQQKLGETYKEGKTFKGADARALYATSIASFLKRNTVSDALGKNSVSTYLRPFHQIEATNSNFLVTGMYEAFSTKTEKQVMITRDGKQYYKIVENLEAKVKQEYNRIKREWARRQELANEYNDGEGNRIINKYNGVLDENGKASTEGDSLKAYQFKALEDFFNVNTELRDTLINSAKENIEFDDIKKTDTEDTKTDLLVALQEYTKNEFERHLNNLVDTGIITRKTDAAFVKTKPEVWYESTYLPKELEDDHKKSNLADKYNTSKKVSIAENVKGDVTNLEHVMFDYFCNHLENAMSVNELFDGDIAMNVSGFVDYVKRAKRWAAAGSTMKEGTHRVTYLNTITQYINERYPTYGPYTTVEEIENDINIPNDAIRSTLIDGFKDKTNHREIFDGQSMSLIMHQMDVFNTLGRMDSMCQKLLIAKHYRQLSEEEETYLEKHKIVMNPKKTITATRFQNHKQSESYIDRNDVSILTEDAQKDIEATYNVLHSLYATVYNLRAQRQDIIIKHQKGLSQTKETADIEAEIEKNINIIHSFYVPMPHREMLHNMLNAMEFHQIDQLMDTTASKNATLLPIDLFNSKKDEFGYLNFKLSSLEVNNNGKYMQVETSGVKDTAKVSVQKKVLVVADLANFEDFIAKEVERSGISLTEDEKLAIKEIPKILNKYQSSLTEGTKARLLYLKTIFRKDGNFDIAQLYDIIRENLIAQGAPSNAVRMFELDANRKPIFGTNLPAVRNTLEFYFFKLYSKHVTDEKAFGFKNFHESSFGYTVLEDINTRRLITTDEIRKNPTEYSNKAKYRTRPLGISVEVENGITKYYVEAIVPKPHFESPEEEAFWMNNIAKQFGMRIPTEDKRSMVVIKVVDFVDSAKKNSIIVPHFVHLLAGSDFDIDSLFGQMMAHYKTLNGSYSKYGDYTAYSDKKTGKFFEFMQFMGENSEFSDQIKHLKKQIRERGLEYAEGGVLHQQVLALGFTQDEIDQLFERAELKNDIATLKVRSANLFKLKDEAKEEFIDAIEKSDANELDEDAWKLRRETGKDIWDYNKELRDVLLEKKIKYERLNSLDYKRLSKLTNAFITLGATIQVLDQYNVPATKAEFEKAPIYQSMVPYVHQNKNLQASMDILSNAAVHNRLWINQRSSPQIYKDILNMFGLSLEDLKNKGSIFSIDYAVAAKIENAMNKDGIAITAALNKVLALASQYGLSLTEKEVIWKFKQTLLNKDGTVSFKDIFKNKFGQLNDDGERTVKLIGIILGIFADGVKDPIPAALNLNEINSGITLSLVGVGLKPEFAMGMNFIPLIKNAVKIVQESRYALSESQSNDYLFFNSILEDVLEEFATKDTLKELVNAGLLKTDYIKSKLIKENLIIDFTPKQLDLNKLKSNTLTVSDIGYTVRGENGIQLSDAAAQVVLTKMYSEQASQTWLIRKAGGMINFFKSLNPSNATFDKLTNGMEEILNGKLFDASEVDKKLMADDQVWPIFQELAVDLNEQAALLFLERTPFFKPLVSLFNNKFENNKTIANVITSFVSVRRLLATQSTSREASKKTSTAARERIEKDDANLMNTFTPEFPFTNDLGKKLKEMQEAYPDNALLNKLREVVSKDVKAIVVSSEGKKLVYEKFIKIIGREKLQGLSEEAVQDAAIDLYNKEPLFVKELFYHELARTGMMPKKGSFLSYLPLQFRAPISVQTDKFVSVLKKSFKNDKFDVKIFKKEISEFMNFENESDINSFFDELFLQIAYAAANERNSSKIKKPNSKGISMFLGSEQYSAAGSVSALKFEDASELTPVQLRTKKQNTIANVVSHVIGIPVKIGDKVILAAKDFPDEIVFDLTVPEHINGANKTVMSGIAKRLNIPFDTESQMYSFPSLYKIGNTLYMIQGVDDSIANNSIGKTMVESLTKSSEFELKGFKAKYIPVPNAFGSDNVSPIALTKKQAELYKDYASGKKTIQVNQSAVVEAKLIEEKKQEVPTQSSTSVEEGIKIPAYTVDINLTNADGTKRLASTNGTTIKLNPVKSVQEFFNYFEGNEVGPSSAQKKMVLVEMEKQGYPLKKIKSILNTTKLANTFLVLHEQDHIDQNDIDVYWKMSKSDLLTPDKLLIETRASINALKKIESTQPSTSVKNFNKKNLFTVTPQQGVSDNKAKAKASIATQYIGFGEDIVGKDGKRSTTQIYREQAGKYANTGNYSVSDVIFVSVPGLRGNDKIAKREQDKTINEAIKAVEAGATILTDNKAYTDASSYNTGEKRLYKNMEAKEGYNYSEITVDGQVIGTWSKTQSQTTVTSDVKVISEKTSTSIKPGVSELFESNPELANAVYEALSFKTSGLQTFKDKLIDIIGVDNVKELYAGTDVKFDSFIIDEVELGTDKDLIITIKTDKGQRTAINLRLDGDYQQLKISEGGKTVRGIYAPLSEKKTAIDFLISEFKNLDTQEITPQQKQQAQQRFQEYVNATGKQDIEGFKKFVTQPSTSQTTTAVKPGTLQDRVVTVAQFKISVKPDGRMFYDNGNEVTDQTTKNKVQVNIEVQEGIVRISSYNNVNYFVLSDNRIIKADKTDLGKETVSDPSIKEKILLKAVLYKPQC